MSVTRFLQNSFPQNRTEIFIHAFSNRPETASMLLLLLSSSLFCWGCRHRYHRQLCFALVLEVAVVIFVVLIVIVIFIGNVGNVLQSSSLIVCAFVIATIAVS